MTISVGVDTPNELMAVFSNTVSAGFSALQGPVNGVFSLMIALVVALTGVQWALSPNREVLASGFGKILLIGANGQDSASTHVCEALRSNSDAAYADALDYIAVQREHGAQARKGGI